MNFLNIIVLSKKKIKILFRNRNSMKRLRLKNLIAYQLINQVNMLNLLVGFYIK